MTVRSMGRLAFASAFAVVFVALMAGSANAATLRSTSAGFRYDAAAGEANDVVTTTDGRDLLFADEGATLTGALPKGCVAEAAAAGFAARCTAGGQLELRAELGDGDD